jgi:predicted  nucleic acid-binding Zn-ribbon protein
MEKILNQILEELKSLKEGQQNLQQGQQDLQQGQNRLENIVKEIDRKTSAIFDQTADLSEFKTSTVDSLSRIETELNTIEKVTAKNCFDITHLKAIK